MSQPREGQRYTRPDGSRVRVDRVANGQVYFVSWKPGQEQGCPIRMLVTDFKIAIRNERMELTAEQDTGIRLRCPSCSARGERSGFRVFGQFCSCGWKRDTESNRP